MQCGTSHLQTVQETILSRIILATYRKFTVATVRFTQNVTCNIYTHPIYQQIGKCHCVIIHQTKKNYWIHRVDVKVSAQVTTVTYKHQSQPSSHSLRINLTVHLELWSGNHLIWCNATSMVKGRREGDLSGMLHPTPTPNPPSKKKKKKEVKKKYQFLFTLFSEFGRVVPSLPPPPPPSSRPRIVRPKSLTSLSTLNRAEFVCQQEFSPLLRSPFVM